MDKLEKTDKFVEELLSSLLDKCIDSIAHYFFYTKGEPMDGDDVEIISSIFRLKLNLHQGNITKDEYDKYLWNILHENN